MDCCAQDLAREGPERIDRVAETKSRQGDGRHGWRRWPGDHRHLLPEDDRNELPVRAVPRGAPLNQDMLAGHIDFGFGQAASTFVHVRNGNLKAYAVMARRRWAAAPDVPTIDEAGVPGLYASFWHGLWVPKGTPTEPIARLNLAVQAALADAAVRQRFADQGQDVPPREQQTPEALAAQQKAEIEKWWPILKAANIKGE